MIKMFVIALLGGALLLGCAQVQDYSNTGENFKALNSLSGGKGIVVNLQVEKDNYKVGQEVAMGITSSLPGKLWVLQVGAQDRLTLLYPNRVAAHNEIKADESLRLPPASADWRLDAQEPLGVNLLVALITPADIDEEEFKALLEGVDGLQIKEALLKLPQWGAAKKVIRTTE